MQLFILGRKYVGKIAMLTKQKQNTISAKTSSFVRGFPGATQLPLPAGFQNSRSAPEKYEVRMRSDGKLIKVVS